MTASQKEQEERREYPLRPVVGVAAVVVIPEKVLLVQRGKEPMRGRWSLPGGMLELGESVEDGVAREALEETGLSVRPLELVEVVERILRDDAGAIRYHYILLDWLCVPVEAGGAQTSSPVAGSDAKEAVWAPIDALDRFELDSLAIEVIRRAVARAGELSLA